jgi:hypothetical protein
MALEPGVNVTLKDIYDSVRKIEVQMSEILPKVQAITDHEARLRTLERWKYALPSSVVLAGVSLVVAVVETKP